MEVRSCHSPNREVERHSRASAAEQATMQVGSFGNRKFARSPISESEISKNSFEFECIAPAPYAISVCGTRKFGEYLPVFQQELACDVKPINTGDMLSFH